MQLIYRPAAKVLSQCHERIAKFKKVVRSLTDDRWLIMYCTHVHYCVPWTANVKNYSQRLAITNRSRISIRVTKNFGQGRGCGRPCEIFLTSSLITMQNLGAVSHAMWMHIGGPKNLGDVRLRPLRWGRIWSARNTPLSACVTVPNLVAIGKPYWG